jgi:glycosyltransferase involved in cell wall biosynthesis
MVILHVFLSAIASKFSKAKHVHTTHCPWSDAKRSLIGNIGLFISYNLFSRWALKSADKIIAITPWEISFIEKYGGIKNKIAIIPNGVSKEFFNKIKNNDFKKKNHILGKNVLFFGRLNPTKSPDLFVEIASEITKNRKDLSFTIVGPDEGLLNKVKNMAQGNKLIHILPALRDREEVIKMYQSSEVYVLPSYREGLPLTIFEAMASGLPIVATPVNGVPYEVKDNKNGFLVNYGDKKGFVEKITKLVDTPLLNKRIAFENIKKSKNYDWDSISEKTTKIYISILDNKLK